VSVVVEVGLEEVLGGDCEKTINVEKLVKCPSCHGTREQEGSESMNCYSCKGTGIKKDPLFHSEAKCNTCKGHGSIVHSPCKRCNGEGIV